jgi:hypothetical protein
MIKEKTCYVAKQKGALGDDINYTMPDNSVIKIKNSDRTACCEILF